MPAIDPQTPACLAAALDYLARGWSAIPLCPPDHAGVHPDHLGRCQSPGKAPLGSWADYQRRLASPKELRLGWARNPRCNVGVVLGPVSGLLGVDIDSLAGAELLEKLAGGHLPATLAFDTPSGGKRLLYALPTDLNVSTRIFKDAQGSEILRFQARGAQTVMPPSVGANGIAYRWIAGCGPDEIPAAPTPASLLTLLQTSPQEESPGGSSPAVPAAAPGGALAVLQRARAYLARCAPAVAGQGGHNQTFRVACKLVRGFDLDEDTALALLVSEYNPRCVPAWSEKELRHKVREAALKSTDPVGHLLGPRPSGNPQTPSTPIRPRAASRPFCAIQPRPVQWLWPARVPIGKVTLLDGDPGLGKSTVLLDLAARVSTQGQMPDTTQGMVGNVLITSAEDDPEDTIRPRLELAGADLARVHFLDEITTAQGSHDLCIPADLDVVSDLLQDLEVRLWIIDPLMAFLAGIEANSDQDVRQTLKQLSRLARLRQCAVLCQRHLNKGSSMKALYRGGGSIGIIAHARSALLAAVDPDDEHKRLLAVVKSNRAAFAPTLRYALEPVAVQIAGRPDVVCRVGWCGESSHQADSLLAAPPTPEQKEEKLQEKTKRQQAMEWLQDYLRAGPQRVSDVHQDAAALGIARRTLERAAHRLGVRFAKEEGEYRWALPLSSDGELASSPEPLPP